jgi:hypothetical protein
MYVRSRYGGLQAILVDTVRLGCARFSSLTTSSPRHSNPIPLASELLELQKLFDPLPPPQASRLDRLLTVGALSALEPVEDRTGHVFVAIPSRSGWRQHID